MLIFKVLYEKLVELDTKSDPRTAHLSLEASLKCTFALVALYLFVALKLGPAFMSNRKAFEIKRIIQIYNLTQIVNLHDEASRERTQFKKGQETLGFYVNNNTSKD
uniref:Elongation of very long chain fatty acids protein n=1 Tax=Glossina brevipalpis TaxID=37001 RepID=A0A1A9WA15_9MUSC